MTDFVGDYSRQKKIAEALRARQKALMSTQIDSSPIVTQASGAFPGQVQANYAAPLAQIANAWMAKRAGEQADTADVDLTDQRRAALQGIMGGQQQPAQPVPMGGDVGPVPQGQAPMTPAGQMGAAPPPTDFEMTPDKMLQLNEMGIDSGMIQMMKPEKEKLANFLQAIPNMSPELARSMAAKFKIDPAVAEQAINDYRTQRDADMRAKADLQMEVARAGRNPVQPRDPKQRDPLKDLQAQYVTQIGQGDSEGAKRTLETLQALKAAVAAPGGPGSRGGNKKPVVTPEEAEGKLGELEGILNSPEAKDIFSPSARGQREFANQMKTSTNPIAASIGVMIDPKGAPTANVFDSIVSDFGLEKIAQLYPASDTDVKWIMQNLASSRTNLDTAKAMVGHLRNVHSKFGVKTPDSLAATPAQTPADTGKRPAGFDRWPADAQQEWLEAQ